MTFSTWYRDETLWCRIYPYMLNADRQRRTPKEVDGIITLLNLQQNDAILDLACGDGRQLRELARRGFANLTGVDLTNFYIDIARQRALEEQISIQFQTGDMLYFQQPDTYDDVLLLFSSFGFFEQPADNLRVLQNAYQSLKRGGKLLVDVRSKESFAYTFDAESWSELGAGNFLLTKRIPLLDFSVLENRWMLIEQGFATELTFWHWIYSAAELKSMFESAGFVNVAAYGSEDGRAFMPQSPRLIVIGQKPT
ncbi:MAG TPA: methyltransferase domain-containing protein [Candidatus Acidoferrum sp.]|nr:methyltransferase domain-containing protein [Candidatus Acidoferrum sp.]